VSRTRRSRDAEEQPLVRIQPTGDHRQPLIVVQVVGSGWRAVGKKPPVIGPYP